jgi:hypothetical protein
VEQCKNKRSHDRWLDRNKTIKRKFINFEIIISKRIIEREVYGVQLHRTIFSPQSIAVDRANNIDTLFKWCSRFRVGPRGPQCRHLCTIYNKITQVR